MGFFLTYDLEDDREELLNREPEKCSELVWANRATLPHDTIPYVRAGIENFNRGVWFQEFGWEPAWSNATVPPTAAVPARAADRGARPTNQWGPE